MEEYKVIKIQGKTIKVGIRRRIYMSKYKMFYYKDYTKLCNTKIPVKVDDKVGVVFGRKRSSRKSGMIVKIL